MGTAELTRTVNSTPFRELVKFSVVGASGVIVNLTILGFAMVLGTPLIPAAMLSFLGAATSNYILNRAWTFRSREGVSVAELERFTGRGTTLTRQWAKFLAVSVVGLVANLVVLVLLTQGLGVWYIFGQLAGIGAGTLLNFGLSRAWVFRRPFATPA